MRTAEWKELEKKIKEKHKEEFALLKKANE